MAGAAGSEEEGWKILLQKHRVELLKSMKFHDTLLWDYLVQRGVVTKEQYLSQKDLPDLKMGRYVLDLIAFKSQYEGFLEALRESDQGHVADLLKDETEDVIVTRMQSLSLNQVTVFLVGPWFDKTTLENAGIKHEETWLMGDKEISPGKKDEMQEMIRFLVHSLRKLMPSLKSQDSGTSVLMIHHIVVDETVDQENQEMLLDVLIEHPADIVYFICNMERPVSNHMNIADKFNELLELSVVLTDATCMPSDITGRIRMGYLCFECITVGYKSTLSDTTPWGGLVDLVIPKNVWGTDDDGRGYVIKCESCPAVYAVATVISVLHNARSIGIIQTDLNELKRSRTMRRVLISMCKNDDPGKHDPLEGFGTLKPEGFLKDLHALKEKVHSSIAYYQKRRMPRESQRSKVDHTPTYTETNKTTLVRQLTSHQVDPAHKVVVGILGSGLNPNHPLLAGRQLDMSSVSVCGREQDQTQDCEDRTTSYTACLVNLLCTAGGDSLLNRVRLVHIKYTKSDGTSTDEDYSEGLEQVLHQGVQVVLQYNVRLHPVATWSGVKLIQRLRDVAVFIATAIFLETKPHYTFPQTEVLGVSGVTSDGRLSPDAAAGPRLDFVAPEYYQTTGHGRPLPDIYMENTTSFTGAVTVYILVLARIHGLDESRIRRLSTTSVMRAILIEMCSHPERRTASMGYGVLDPWPFLNDWTKLGPIVMKCTDPDAEPMLWAGKDI